MLMTIVLLFLPVSTGYSGLGWAGVAESEYTMGTAVSYSPNGDVLASGHKNSILITEAQTQAHVQAERSLRQTKALRPDTKQNTEQAGQTQPRNIRTPNTKHQTVKACQHQPAGANLQTQVC